MKFYALAVVLVATGCTRNKPQHVDIDAGLKVARVEASDAGTRVVRFVAVGDTGKGNDGQRQVGQAIGSLCTQRGCDFVVLLGDNFYPTGVSSTTDPQWQTAFVEPYATVNAPFYVVLGNHDYGGNGSGNELDKGQHQIDYSQVNPKWRLPNGHYRFSMQHVDFFVADTNRSMYAVDSAARKDFEQWLPTSSAEWKIVFGHHTYYSNGRHGNAGNYERLPSLIPIATGAGVKSFVDELICGRADVYLCGHDHALEWVKATCTRPDAGLSTEFLVSGGGATVTSFPKEMITDSYWHAESLGFVYVVIDGHTFTGTYFNQNGEVLFTRSFTKP